MPDPRCSYVGGFFLHHWPLSLRSLILEQKPIAATHPRYLLFRFLNNPWILRQLVSGPRQGTGHRLLIVIEVWPSLLAYAATASCPAKGLSSESKQKQKHKSN